MHLYRYILIHVCMHVCMYTKLFVISYVCPTRLCILVICVSVHVNLHKSCYSYIGSTEIKIF